ncbi:putative nucleoside-diphosphate-sugar epimerase protein [Rosellinia necatrix]|uniref:Putative nucleoside-diphosphate-sugar epimerase protein n=1 Tax=Rosellinia necatrix TaxID=77044 RepID=A0A1W2TIB8_ROSNE|nr:putative nucleoside-diphosphate-sugar epimerase protein [Rosellinia necatrix]
MKLIISGATGFVGREVLRQSLSHPKITSVVALARTPVAIPEGLPTGSDTSKLKAVVIQDYEVYPGEVKKELSGAHACIWTVAITPTKSKTYAFEEVKRVCQTTAIAGLKSMHEAGTATPFRFLYMSGAASERDPTKTPKFMPEYCLMRGETESMLLALAQELGSGIEVAAAKPGYITASGYLARSAMAAVVRTVSGIPSIDVVDLAAAMIEQVVEGFEKEPLMPEDLIRIAGTISHAT